MVVSWRIRVSLAYVILAVCCVIHILHVYATEGAVTVSVTDKYRYLKSGYELYTMEFQPCGSFKVSRKGAFNIKCKNPPIGRAVYFNLFSYFGLDPLFACEIYVEGSRKYHAVKLGKLWRLDKTVP